MWSRGAWDLARVSTDVRSGSWRIVVWGARRSWNRRFLLPAVAHPRNKPHDQGTEGHAEQDEEDHPGLAAEEDEIEGDGLRVQDDQEEHIDPERRQGDRLPADSSRTASLPAFRVGPSPADDERFSLRPCRIRGMSHMISAPRAMHSRTR